MKEHVWEIALIVLGFLIGFVVGFSCKTDECSGLNQKINQQRKEMSQVLELVREFNKEYTLLRFGPKIISRPDGESGGVGGGK